MRGTAPDDLRIRDTTGPRRRSDDWSVGDVVTLGRERWAIRVITGTRVELEAFNTLSGIWWTTTLDRIPEKAIRLSTQTGTADA